MLHQRYYLSFTNNGSLQELTEAVVPSCLQNRCSLKCPFKNVNLQENTSTHFNKVVRLHPAVLLRKRLQQKRFPVNFE